MITPTELKEKSADLVKENGEFYWRESARLAYYAIFHEMCIVAQKYNINLESGEGGRHKRALDNFSTYSEVASDFVYFAERMKQYRIMADYDIYTDFTKDNANAQQNLLILCEDELAKM